MSQRSRRDFLWVWDESLGLHRKPTSPPIASTTHSAHPSEWETCPYLVSQTPCQHTAFPGRGIQPLSFQPAQSTGSARPRKTSQCTPLHLNVGLRFPSSPPNGDEALPYLLPPTPPPNTLPEWDSCLHGYLSPASSPSPPSQTGQRFLLSLSRTHTDTPLHCPG